MFQIPIFTIFSHEKKIVEIINEIQRKKSGHGSSAWHGATRKWGKSGGQEHEVVAVETSRVTVPLRPIAGYYFRTAVARPHGEQLTSLSRSTTKAARYYLFSLAKVLWSWRDTRREWRTEPSRGCERLLTYFFHPSSPNLRDYWMVQFWTVRRMVFD